MAERFEVWWPLPQRWRSHRVGARPGSTQGWPGWQVASYSYHGPGMALGPMAAASKPPRGTEGRAAATSDKDAKSPWLGPCGVEGHSHSDSGGERLPASIASGSHASGPTGACETCCAAGSAAQAAVLRAVRLAHGVAVLGRAGFSSSAASEEDS